MNRVFNIFCLTFVISLTLLSQVPQAFNYQAVVRNADGAVMANKDISLKIEIISNTDTDYPVYSEKHDTRTDKLGYIHLEIGKGIVISGSFDEIDWSGSCNVQISFKEIGEGEYQVLGVVQLLSVPYALYAESAGNSNNTDVDSTNELQALSISNDTIYLTEGGYVKLPSVTTGDDDTSSTNELQALTMSNDTLYLSKGNYVVLTDSNQWASNNNDIFYDKGNIGIGITQPKTKLHVSNGDILVDNPNNGIVLVSPNGTHWKLTINNDGSLNVDTMKYTLILQPGPEKGKDAIISSCQPDLYKGDVLTFEAVAYSWTSLTCEGAERSVMDINLNSIPVGAVVKKATLYLFNPHAEGFTEHQTLSGSNECVLKRITTPWDENTVTWNTQPSTTNLNMATLPESISPTQDYIVDITNLIVDYLNNLGSSYGFLLQLVTEVKYRTLIFASSDFSDANRRPKLEIVYTIEP